MSLSSSPLGQTNNAQVISLVAASTAYTIATSQSGSIVQVPAVAALCTITLPPVATAAGFTLKAQVSATPLAIVRFGTVAAGTLSCWKVNLATVTSTAALVNYVQFTATALPGDYIEINCDGVTYSAIARSVAAAGVSSA